ncbi:hypothetical protein GGQ99_000995 [Aminobacter niigataensis]|uniref:Uncharacterized protein n=1 Tax=Aminobacter niigataensis TaxID=83265 RepID=A0ABR6KXY2_9HYPH|nr:hypothetical protein [Aminobacter niigataensis]MBB4649273.1 hypothetical protein [Aminobacter niigataensis]
MSRFLIRACRHCKGDGFYRCCRDQVHPLTNIASAKVILSPAGPASPHGALYDYASRIWGYEFKCHVCRGNGEVFWTRGRSLTP